MGDRRASTWGGFHRIVASLRAKARAALLGPALARRGPLVGGDAVRLGSVLWVIGALALALTVTLLAGGCARSESSTVTALPDPTQLPTATTSERHTATDTPVPTPHVDAVLPNRVPAGQDSVTMYVRGENFCPEPYLFLAHPSHGEIEATDVEVYPGACKARCVFDISEAKPGLWSVQVINLDGKQSELFYAFEIVPPTPTSTPTVTSTPSSTPTATVVIVPPTYTPTPTATAMPTARPQRRKPTPIPTLPPPSSQP